MCGRGILFYHWDYLSEFVYIKKRIDVVQRMFNVRTDTRMWKKQRQQSPHFLPLWNSKQYGIISFLIKPSSSLRPCVHSYRITFRFSGCSKPYLKWSAFWDYLNYCFNLKYYLVFSCYRKFAGMWWWTKCKKFHRCLLKWSWMLIWLAKPYCLKWFY